MNTEKEEFEKYKDSVFEEIQRERHVLDSISSLLSDKIDRISIRERELEQRISELENDREAWESSKNQSYLSGDPIKEGQTSQSTQTTGSNLSTPADSKNPTETHSSLPYKSIQFTATGPGRTYPDLAYLGEVVSEQIPGRNIYRYKIRGRFTDQKVKYVISELQKKGYPGAFVN